MRLPYKVTDFKSVQKNFDYLAGKFGFLRLAGANGGPVFAANWADYGGGFAGLACWKVGPIVVVRGVIFKNLAVVLGETMATLAPDCVPEGGRLIFSTISNGVGPTRVDIDANGNILNLSGPGFGGAVGAVAGGAAFISIQCVFLTTK